MADQTGVRFGLASGAVVASLLLAGALPLDHGESALVGLFAAAVAATAVPWTLAIVLGTEAWAFFTGFFENRYGVLTLADHDLLRLLGFAVGTVLFAQVFRTPVRLATAGDRP
jgi:hypothetical protein